MVLSIVTVTLNDLDNLKITAESLINQTNKNFQWIIKDGCSTDGTNEFVNTIKDREKLFIDYHSEKDTSLYDAMNQSIKYINGKYVLFLNAGDYLYSKNTLQSALDVINNFKELDFFYGNNYDLTSTNLLIFKKSREITYLSKSLPTSHQAIFYNSKLFKKFTYPLEFSVAADYAITAMMFFGGNKSYKQLNIPICVFKLDGYSKANRKILLKEGFLIHKNIVNDNIIKASFKYIIRFFTFFVHDNFPILYKKIRFFFDNRNKD